MVAPVDQILPVGADEVKVTEPPAQNVVGPLGVMVGVAGNAFTVTTIALLANDIHPLASPTWQVYVPEDVTLIFCVVSPPGDHKYDVEVGAESITEPPAQKVIGPPAVMVGVEGNGFTVTVTGELAGLEQPAALVTTTEYVPEVVTLMLEVVKLPGDHK